MGLSHRLRPRHATRNDEIVADLQAVGTALATLDHRTVLQEKAEDIADLMALLHGGHWRVRIDHDEGVVMIARRGRRQTL